jgi:hypothetical protein
MRGHSAGNRTSAKKNSSLASITLKAGIEANAPFVICIPDRSFTTATQVSQLSVSFHYGNDAIECEANSDPRQGYLLIHAVAPSAVNNEVTVGTVVVSFDVAQASSFSGNLEATLYPPLD